MTDRFWLSLGDLLVGCLRGKVGRLLGLNLARWRWRRREIFWTSGWGQFDRRRGLGNNTSFDRLLDIFVVIALWFRKLWTSFGCLRFLTKPCSWYPPQTDLTTILLLSKQKTLQAHFSTSLYSKMTFQTHANVYFVQNTAQKRKPNKSDKLWLNFA